MLETLKKHIIHRIIVIFDPHQCSGCIIQILTEKFTTDRARNLKWSMQHKCSFGDKSIGTLFLNTRQTTHGLARNIFTQAFTPEN